MNRLGFVLICIAILIKTSSKAQNDSNFNNLIESGNFKLLESEFKEKYSSSDLAYLNFLRATASSYSNNKLNGVAVSIMKYCCDWYQNSNECDTIKLNNLHLLGMYYSFAKEEELSFQVNQLCLKKRLACKKVDQIDVAKSLNNIGVFYLNQKKYDSSLVYFEKSYEYFHSSNFENSSLKPIIYTNYLDVLTLLGKVKLGEKIIIEWNKISKDEIEISRIIKTVSRNIHELLARKDINNALKYNKLNENILTKYYGEKSLRLIEYKLIFALELGKQKFDQESLKMNLKLEEAIIKLEPYRQLSYGISLATGIMNTGKDSIALQKFNELKEKYLIKFADSSSIALLLTNLATCYFKLGDFENMRATKKEFYSLIDKNKFKINYQWLYTANLDKDLFYYTENEDFENRENVLLKLVDFYKIIGDYDNLILNKLNLSNAYLFDKSEIEKSREILEDIENELTFCKDIDKSKAYYYYQLGEYNRRKDNSNQYNYYAKAIELFDSIKFYPIEYENSLYKYAEFLLDQGYIEEGVFQMKRYLHSGNIDTTSVNYLARKIFYLDEISDYQTDTVNDFSSLNLINQIEALYGTQSEIYHKAARILNYLVLDVDLRKEIICKWINSYRNNKNSEYFKAKITLAYYFFDTNNEAESDKIWNNIIDESKYLNGQQKKTIFERYIHHKVRTQNKGFGEALQILDSLGIGFKDFDQNANENYLYIYLGLKDYSSAFTYLTEKEKYILTNFNVNSNEYFDLMNEFIFYFMSIENTNFEKIYREKELGLFFEYQPKNKKEIILKTINLVGFLNKINLMESSLMHIKKAKLFFDISIDSTKDLYDLYLLQYEIMTEIVLKLKKGSIYNLELLKKDRQKLNRKILDLKSTTQDNNKKLILDVLLELNAFGNNESFDDIANWNDKFVNLYISSKSPLAKGIITENDLKEMQIRDLLKKDEIDLAKHLLKENGNLKKLEEIYYESGQLDSALYYKCKIEQIDLLTFINSSKCLLDNDLDKKREIQKNSLNFAIGRYLNDNLNINKISTNTKASLFELIINNYGLISAIKKDFFSYLRSTDSLTKNQYYSFSNKIHEKSNISYDLDFNINHKLADRKSPNLSWTSLDKIKSTIDDSSALVLTYKYVYNGFGKDLNSEIKLNYYLTLIVFAEDSSVFLLDSNFINSEKDLVDYYLEGVNKKDINSTFSFVYQQIWAKIDEQIPQKIKRIYLITDGIYNSVNVGTLYDKNAKKYIQDKYEIIVKDNSEIISNKFSRKNDEIKSAVLIGFPNYNKYSVDTSNRNLNSLNLNNYYSSITRGNIVKGLPGTKSEIENIGNLLKSHSYSTSILKGDEASEENIKKINSPDILHIATHGFFIDNKTSFPMLNSGLLFAGCNNKVNILEDGFLSAYEISLLNLDSTKLVVLSACETGRGLLKDGDGVFGLKQGCLNAGAKNIIMSLWKVDDNVTQEFMSRFYEVWLKDKTSIREAFNKTQLEIKAKYPQPYYWGAFILVGE